MGSITATWSNVGEAISGRAVSRSPQFLVLKNSPAVLLRCPMSLVPPAPRSAPQNAPSSAFLPCLPHHSLWPCIAGRAEAGAIQVVAARSVLAMAIQLASLAVGPCGTGLLALLPTVARGASTGPSQGVTAASVQARAGASAVGPPGSVAALWRGEKEGVQSCRSPGALIQPASRIIGCHPGKARRLGVPSPQIYLSQVP